MAFAGHFPGQAPGASPWSAGIPPGQQGPQPAQAQQPNNRQPQQVPQQPMFQQPMGAFDMTSAWQGQQQQAAAQQWAMQQVQFVPNPAFMQQPQQPAPMRNPQMNQRGPMQHQRSLSASRAGGFGNNGNPKRSMNQNNNNNNFGGPQGQQQQQNWQRNNNNNNNNNNQYQSRVGRQQQARMNNNQRGPQFNNNNNNNNNHNNSSNGRQNNNNNGQQQQRQQNQQQQQQPQGQQQQQQKVVRKVTKVRKQSALRSKLKNADGSNKSATEAGANASGDSNSNNNNAASATTTGTSNQESAGGKPQSKTAERKQFKLQARRNAEAMKQSKVPVVRPVPKVEGGSTGTEKAKIDEPIDQAQLKCVPAVFGFVCKLCDVFLRDKIARREHIDSSDHMEKFKEFEEREKLVVVKQEPEAVQEPSAELSAATDPSENATVQADTSLETKGTEQVKAAGNLDEVVESAASSEQESGDANQNSDSQVKEEPVVG